MATGRLPDPNSAPVTAKGDLYTYSTVPAKLAVGNNGETLLADSAATTGLRWQPQFLAGKNKIINGDFGIWQRGTTFNSAANGAYTADRYTISFNGTGATRNLSQQTFTAGSAPVAGYEGQFYHRYAQTVAGTGGTFSNFGTRIEDVRQLAGLTATFSFWARVSSGTISVQPYVEQYFGSGGSASVYNTMGSAITITTDWQRFTGTASIPSISGKTLGSGNHLFAYFSLPNNATFTLDTWGWQLEAGSVATPFSTATGTLQGELAACMRYYQRFNSDQIYAIYAAGAARSTTQADFLVPFLVPLRTSPSSIIDYANLGMNQYNGDTIRTVTALVENSVNKSPLVGVVTATHTGTNFTQGDYYRIFNNNTTAGYIGFSAEL